MQTTAGRRLRGGIEEGRSVVLSQAIVAVENAIAPGIVGMKVDMVQLNALPEIVAEMFKLAE